MVPVTLRLPAALVLLLSMILVASCSDEPTTNSGDGDDAPATTTTVEPVADDDADDADVASIGGTLPPVEAYCNVFDVRGETFPFKLDDMVCFFDNAVCQGNPDRVVYVTQDRSSWHDEELPERGRQTVTCATYLRNLGEFSYLLMAPTGAAES